MGPTGIIKKSKIPFSKEGVRRKPHGLTQSGAPGKCPDSPRSGGGTALGADGHFLRKSKSTFLEGGSTAKPHGLTQSGAPGKCPDSPRSGGGPSNGADGHFLGSQQMRGRSSPPGGGSMVCAPMAVVTTTLPAGSGRTSPMTAASFE